MPVKEHQLGGAVGDFHQQQSAAGLGNCFHNEHTGHYRGPGKMTGKEGLVDGHILDGGDALFANVVGDPVDQQKRETMRQ